MLAIPWYFTGVIHREGLFGTTYFFITAASLAWGLYAGTLIDKFDRKHIFLGINLTGLLVLSTISLIGFKNDSLPWFLVACVFATTMFIYNIHFPNLYAYAQQITTKESYSKVTSLLEIQGQFTFTIAGALAAILLKGIDHQINFFGVDISLPFTIRPWKIHEIFMIDAVTYLAAFIIIYRIKSLPVVLANKDLSSLKERLKTGFSFLKKHPAIFHFGNASMLVFLTIIVFGTYLQPIYVDTFLQQGGDVYAFGDMAFSLGALLAGFLTAIVFGNKKPVQGIILLSAVSGVMYAVMVGSKILFLFFLANFLIGSCNSAIRIQRITYLFHHIPNHVIGRANGVFFAINVFLRLLIIGLFSIPFFHEGNNVLLSVGVLSLVCFSGAIILSLLVRRLNSQKVTG